VLIVGKIDTPKRAQQIAIESGISDNIYAIDVETGTLLAENIFSIRPSHGTRHAPGRSSVPGGLTATPIIAPLTFRCPRVYVLAGTAICTR